MKHPGFKKYLIFSIALIFIVIMAVSVIMVPVQGEDDGGGVHGEEDEEYLEIQCSKDRYKVGESIPFSVTSHFNEAIVMPLPYICNSLGDVVEAWGRADVMPPPMLQPGQTDEDTWNPWKFRDVDDIPTGIYYLHVEHDGVEYTQQFSIFEPVPVDHAETDEISDGPVLEYPFLMGPESG